MNSIFEACDVDSSDSLEYAELKYALEALGYYNKECIDKTMEVLGLEFPLRREGFKKVAAEMERSGEERKLPALPYARRGLSLRQLKK